MVKDTQAKCAECTLPLRARLPINHCNLPSAILGSLTYQQHPVRLFLDGVQALHGEFFTKLDHINNAAQRALAFKDFMRASFYLDQLEDAGFSPDKQRICRDKADYLRMLRGWMFDADGLEAAVLKSWVESRFGLMPRNHHGPLGNFDRQNYQRYLADRSRGLYNTNSLEAQLDLLYTYCQYELYRRQPEHQHRPLYRGLSHLADHEVLETLSGNAWIMVLNNLNSFTSESERADEFGDIVIRTRVPLPKVVYFPGLLPDSLRGEQEYLVIGGVYKVERFQRL